MENIIPENDLPIKYKKRLVTCGGAVKGIAIVGSFHALDVKHILNKFEQFCGTSIGSVINALYVIGYTPAELYDFIKLFEFDKLNNMSLLNIHLFALDDGSKIEYVFKRLINSKGLKDNITLIEIYELTKKKLIFTTVCVNTTEICYLSHEVEPDLPLLLALRMATAIPFIYPPIRYKDKLYVDGACVDNYPFSVFSDDLDDAIGILIVDKYDNIDDIENAEIYILRIFDCIKHGMAHNCKKGFEKNTIDINLESINIIDYSINNKKKDELFMNGFSATLNYLENL